MSAVPPPPAGDEVELAYTVRNSWAWVMRDIAKSSPPGISSMTEIDDPYKMPSGPLLQEHEGTATPSRRNKKGPQPCTLRLDITSSSGTSEFQYGVHGTSFAFDGLEDKDELFRTLQRCRCEHLNITPPSVLLKWDITRTEINNMIGENLPHLPGNATECVAVLKEPLGNQGKGIHFVSSFDKIFEIMSAHRKRALEEGPDYLDNIIAQKGRIPSFVLQAEIRPPLLVRGGRKFHIRTYVAALEKLNQPDVLEVHVYNRHEVRIAGTPLCDASGIDDEDAHITHGIGLDNGGTERELLSNVDELTDRNISDKVELFAAQLFSQHVGRDVSRRVMIGNGGRALEAGVSKFTTAVLDIMPTEDGRLYLLEANVNPRAPAEEFLEGTVFRDHLVGFMTDLIDLTLNRNLEAPTAVFKGGKENFTSADEILNRKEN